LDFLFEEAGELVALRIETGARDGISPGLSVDALAPALGRPVRELLDRIW
jgi:hypothetical protein